MIAPLREEAAFLVKRRGTFKNSVFQERYSMSQIMVNKNQTTQYHNRFLENDLCELKLNRIVWRIAGVSIGLFFAKTSFFGIQHPLFVGMQQPFNPLINPLITPVFFDIICDLNKLKTIKLEQKNINFLKFNPSISKTEAELLCIKNQRYEELKNNTQTAMNIKAAFVTSGLIHAIAFITSPWRSNPLYGFKEKISMGLATLGIAGMLASSIYGLCHCKSRL